MEWILFFVCLIWLLLLIRLFPALFAPHCPVCGARLQRGDVVEIQPIGKHKHLGWRNFVCPQCLYRHRRPVIYSDSEVTKYEARALH